MSSYSELYANPAGPHPCYTCGSAEVIWTRILCCGGPDDGAEVGECRQCFRFRMFFDDFPTWQIARTWPTIVRANFSDVLEAWRREIEALRAAAA